MKKEIEEALKCVDVLKEDGCITTIYQGKALEIIRQVLLELKSIKETNPSEALKQVTYLSAILPDWQRVNNGVDSLSIIKQALTTKSKKEQAFDIANKKCVDMYRLSVADNVVSYNNWTEFDEYWLTQEEFKLIKEILKND